MAASWYYQICKFDVCMPACFVRQTNIVITIFTGLHAKKLHQEDNRTPSGFAFVMHLRLYQLNATLVS